MINWNDIRVEQQIAQERYQAIIQTRRQQVPATVKLTLYPRLLNWFGQRLIAWGHKLQQDQQQLDGFGPTAVEWSR